MSVIKIPLGSSCNYISFNGQLDHLVDVELYVNTWELFKDDILTSNKEHKVSFTRLCGTIFCQTSPLNTKTCPDSKGFNIDTSLICSNVGFCELCDDVLFDKNILWPDELLVKKLLCIYILYLYICFSIKAR